MAEHLSTQSPLNYGPVGEQLQFGTPVPAVPELETPIAAPMRPPIQNVATPANILDAYRAESRIASLSQPAPEPAPQRPMPPPQYMPEENLDPVQKFFRAMDYTAAAMRGDIPFDLRLQKARLDAQKTQVDIETGWQNYNESQERLKGLTQQHERDTRTEALGMLPRILADITQFPLGSIEREQRVESWIKLVGGSHHSMPGLIRYIGDNSAAVYDMNYTISQDPALQRQVQSRGYPAVITDPDFLNSTMYRGTDAVSKLAARAALDPDFHTRLQSGNMGEAEFIRDALKNADDPRFGEPYTPQRKKFLSEFIQTAPGQQALTSVGVIAKSIAHTAAEARAKWNPAKHMEAAQYQDFMALREKLETEKTLTQDELHRLNVYMKLENKTTPQVPAKITVDQKAATMFMEMTKDLNPDGTQYMRVEEVKRDLAAGKLDPVKTHSTLEAYYKKAYQMAADARIEAEKGKGVNLAENYYYRSQVQEGILEPIETPLTQRDLQSGKILQIPEKKMEALNKMATSITKGHELFETATDLFDADNHWEVFKQAAAVADIQYLGFLGAAMHHDPELKTYINGVAAWASDAARALGGEVGVMTEGDVTRWKAVFPNEFDTQDTVREKFEVYKTMTGYMVKQAIKSLTGKTNLLELKSDRAHRAKMVGYLTQLEKINAKSKAAQRKAQGLTGEDQIKSLRESITKMDKTIESMPPTSKRK